MKAEFTAIIEAAPEGGYWAICPEVPGANGQGETIEETKNSLREAIQLILEDRKADILRGLPEDAIQETVLRKHSHPRSFLSLDQGKIRLTKRELAGLIASAGLQQLPEFVPSVVFETEKTVVISSPTP